MKFSPSIWIPVLQKFYKSLEIPVVIYGSQIIYVNLGIAFESKDIDLLIYDVYPRAIQGSFANCNISVDLDLFNGGIIEYI